MSRCIFLFDLDSTITRKEILPAVAQAFGRHEQIVTMTEDTMQGELPFKQSFLQRAALFKDIPVSKVRTVVEDIDLNWPLVEFMKANKDRCYIVTGNLDVWIEGLVQKIGMEHNVFSSKAVVQNDYIQDIFSVVDKHAVVDQLVIPFVAVGDGNNDAEMIESAEVGIGYGGVRAIAPSVLACASHAIYDEERLVAFLEKLI